MYAHGASYVRYIALKETNESIISNFPVFPASASHKQFQSFCMMVDFLTVNF